MNGDDNVAREKNLLSDYEMMYLRISSSIYLALNGRSTGNVSAVIFSQEIAQQLAKKGQNLESHEMLDLMPVLAIKINGIYIT